MSYHKDKIAKRKAMTAKLDAAFAASDQEEVRLELATMLLAVNKEFLPEYENNVHGFKPELAQSLARLTRKQIARLEHVIALAQSGHSIANINLLGDRSEAQ